MSLKVAILLFACCTLAMGYAVGPKDERQTVDQMQSSNDAPSNNDLNNSNGVSDSNGNENNMRNPLMNFGNRVRNAFDKTYQEEKNSVSDSWNNMKDLMTQRIQTGANLTKTAFDLGTIGPKFGKNFMLAK